MFRPDLTADHVRPPGSVGPGGAQRGEKVPRLAGVCGRGAAEGRVGERIIMIAETTARRRAAVRKPHHQLRCAEAGVKRRNDPGLVCLARHPRKAWVRVPFAPEPDKTDLNAGQPGVSIIGRTKGRGERDHSVDEPAVVVVR